MEKGKNKFEGLKGFAQKSMAAIDTQDLKNKAKDLSETIAEKVEDVRDAAVQAKDEFTDKITELDRMLEASILEYNTAYTLMNDKGIQLFIERKRAVDIVTLVENLINSIAKRPVSFDTDFEKILVNRKIFTDSCDFAKDELRAARDAAAGAGAGLAGGASVVFMAPTAAMWIATTFGTASTGAAISTLSGAAATKAALAWLGGGAVAAGGGGVAQGSALLAMAGPVGWSIAGATVLSSIIVLAKKRNKLNKQKNDEIKAVKKNIEAVKEMDEKIEQLLRETESLRSNLIESISKSMPLYNSDYDSLSEEDKLVLGSLINNTRALAATFGKTLGE